MLFLVYVYMFVRSQQALQYVRVRASRSRLCVGFAEAESSARTGVKDTTEPLEAPPGLFGLMTPMGLEPKCHVCYLVKTL